MNRSAPTSLRSVVFVKGSMKQYRLPFFVQLASTLARSGAALKVFYSEPCPAEAAKGDCVDLPRELGHKVPRVAVASGRAIMQYVPIRAVLCADLVVIVQASGYLANYPLLASSLLGLKRVAFWGHGRNHQGNPASASERLKRCLATAPNWWFSYTSDTSRYLASLGFDPRRITTVNNAVDTTEFSRQTADISDLELRAIRSKFYVEQGDEVALYCGSLYEEKRVPLLLEVGRLVASRRPRFRLVVVGGGEEAPLVQRYAARHPWLRYVGPLFGRDKAACFALARLFLHPGAVGLAILDSFAAGLPFITARDSLHGPELAYLEHDVNGLMSDGDSNSLAEAVISLLRDPSRADRLAAGALRAASEYTLENMVANVERGILRCIDTAAA